MSFVVEAIGPALRDAPPEDDVARGGLDEDGGWRADVGRGGGRGAGLGGERAGERGRRAGERRDGGEAVKRERRAPGRRRRGPHGRSLTFWPVWRACASSSGFSAWSSESGTPVRWAIPPRVSPARTR